MIVAELHGKIPGKLTDKEDLLTSNVFSFFKYSNRGIFRDYLMLLGLQVTLADSQRAEFHFWPSYDDGTEPDLVVICGRYYLLFEAKLYADFAQKSDTTEAQIDREIKMGDLSAKNLNKSFVFIAVSAEYNKNKEKYSKYYNEDYQFIWTNWQLISSFLFNFQEYNPYTLGNEFFNDLYSLLVKKRLRSFIGISILTIGTLLPERHQLFFDSKTSTFRGEFTGFIDTLSKHTLINKYSKNYSKSFFKSLPNINMNTQTTLFYGN